MIHVSGKFLDDVLWKEFVELDNVLEKYIDDITSKIIAESVFDGSADEEVVQQPLIASDVPSTPLPVISAKPAMPSPAPRITPPPQVQLNPEVPPFKKVPRNAPCPCGSGKKFKKCCGKR
ncbi:MAG: SEC-C domain-containing protein [Planctomycetaceae bacterium]|jgi:hypothetical protein|nr:SEC-C domain-containing protein [Planctomycetaceae bacterium]